MTKSISGFTIVELLIVIVAIGILATITIVSYGGIQKRARVVVAQVDVRNLESRLEQFKIDTGAYPSVVASPTYSMDDMATVLKDTKLYDSTRGMAEADREKSFIYCVDSGYENYIIVAVEPLQTGVVIPLGQPLYYASSLFSGPRTMTVTTAGSNGANTCKSVSGNDNFLTGRWSFNTPV